MVQTTTAKAGAPNGLRSVLDQHARQQAPHPLQIRRGFQFRRTPAAARVQREAKPLVMQQSGIVESQRRNERQFRIGQFKRERVFLFDRRIAPAPTAIKLRNQWRGIFDADLIDPVLKAVEREQASVGIYAGRLDRRQHDVRREPCIRGSIQACLSSQRLGPESPPTSVAKCTPIFAVRLRCEFPIPGCCDPDAAAAQCR